MTKQEIKLARDQLKLQREKLYINEIAGFIKHPLVMLFAGYIAIDYAEAKYWPGTQNTMLGPVAAAALRGAVTGEAVINALGKSGVADAVARMSQSGAQAAGALAPLLGALA